MQTQSLKQRKESGQTQSWLSRVKHSRRHSAQASAPYLSLDISAKRVSCFATLVHQPRLYVAFDINDILGLATSFDDDS